MPLQAADSSNQNIPKLFCSQQTAETKKKKKNPKNQMPLQAAVSLNQNKIETYLDGRGSSAHVFALTVLDKSLLTTVRFC